MIVEDVLRNNVVGSIRHLIVFSVSVLGMECVLAAPGQAWRSSSLVEVRGGGQDEPLRSTSQARFRSHREGHHLLFEQICLFELNGALATLIMCSMGLCDVGEVQGV